MLNHECWEKFGKMWEWLDVEAWEDRHNRVYGIPTQDFINYYRLIIPPEIFRC